MIEAPSSEVYDFYAGKTRMVYIMRNASDLLTNIADRLDRYRYIGRIVFTKSINDNTFSKLLDIIIDRTDSILITEAIVKKEMNLVLFYLLDSAKSVLFLNSKASTHLTELLTSTSSSCPSAYCVAIAKAVSILTKYSKKIADNVVREEMRSIMGYWADGDPSLLFDSNEIDVLNTFLGSRGSVCINITLRAIDTFYTDMMLNRYDIMNEESSKWMFLLFMASDMIKGGYYIE